jgi:L-alanine-DL-glutamate epimerase-like enolase superfamily enzyme
MSTTARAEAAVDELEVAAYTIATDQPEADGTLAWDSTTIVVVHAHGGGESGLGYTYADVSTAKLVESKLAGVVCGRDAFSPQGAWEKMVEQTRNLGRPGITSMAIAAVDVALWDLKARLLGLPLCKLIGMAHDRVPVYGSGGFTAYSDDRLAKQLAGWVEQGIPRVKMKVGSEPEADPERVKVARRAIGPNARLFVDANGAYSRKQALDLGERFADDALVSWFEEPVSSEDLEGLRLLRAVLPPHDRGRRGRRAPGRCHPLRRDHRAAQGRRPVPRPQPSALAALRSGHSPASGHCARAARPPRVFPRSRTDRAHAVRRRG